MQAYLGAFYEGFQIGESDFAISGLGIKDMKGMQVGDGSEAAILLWDMNTGNWAAAKLMYAVVRAVMSEMSDYMRSTSRTCQGVDGGKPVDGSIFAACFVWNEAYAAADNYIASQREYRVCVGSNRPSAYKTPQACVEQTQLSQSSLNHVFWNGINGASDPKHDLWIALSGPNVQFDCGWSPMNYVRQVQLQVAGSLSVPGNDALDGQTEVGGPIIDGIRSAIENNVDLPLPTPMPPGNLPKKPPLNSCSN
jgi:hypothetical protein